MECFEQSMVLDISTRSDADIVSNSSATQFLSLNKAYNKMILLKFEYVFLDNYKL